MRFFLLTELFLFWTMLIPQLTIPFATVLFTLPHQLRPGSKHSARPGKLVWKQGKPFKKYYTRHVHTMQYARVFFLSSFLVITLSHGHRCARERSVAGGDG